MKTLLHPLRAGRRPERAFTLVEIVLSLAIVAIALVAIIGVLPIGLNVQTDNQEESIISAEAAIWMEAFRNGAQGMEYLVQDDADGNDFYIDEVKVVEVTRVRNASDPLATAYPDDAVSARRTNFFNNFTSASNLIGVLSRPKYPQNYASLPGGTAYQSWNTYVDTRALNGNMADLSADMDFAFKYRLTPELVPVQGLQPFHLATTNSNLLIIQTNLFELRLNFQWPLVVGAGGGYREQTRFAKSLSFRTIISGQQVVVTNQEINELPLGTLLYFMEPRRYSYLTNPPPANP
jgi:uncharacterized protein (TIGR02598 family)